MMHPRPIASQPMLAIVDPCSAGGYDLRTLGNGTLGGTEATVLRIAAGLRHHFDIVQYQGGRLTS
ncbi:MAG: hypothetical protein P1U53_11475, partial [Sulfitobacter sp.]|nr:hypothetical protein [Sulfitobacter sp.]